MAGVPSASVAPPMTNLPASAAGLLSPASRGPLSISGSTSLGTEMAYYAASGPLDAEDEYGNVYVVWQEYTGTYFEVWADVLCQQSLGTFCAGKATGWQGAIQLDTTYYAAGSGDLAPDIAVTQTGTVCAAWGSSYYVDIFVSCYYGGAWSLSFYATYTTGDQPAIAFDQGGYLVLAYPEPTSTDAVCVAKLTVSTTVSGSCVDYTATALGITYTFSLDAWAISCLNTAATTCTVFYGDGTSTTAWGIEAIHSTNDFATSITGGPFSIDSQTWSTTWKGGWFAGKATENIQDGGATCSETSANCAIAFAADSGTSNPNNYLVAYAYSTNGFATAAASVVGIPPTSTGSISLTAITMFGTASAVIAWNTSTTLYITGSNAQAPSVTGGWGTAWTITTSGTYSAFPGLASAPSSTNFDIGNNIPWRVDVVYPSASATYYAYFYGPALTTPTASVTALDVGQSTTLAVGTYQGPPIAEGFTIPAATGYTWAGLPTGCASTADTFVCSPSAAGVFSESVSAKDTGSFSSSSVTGPTITVNAALSAGGVTPSAPGIDTSQAIALTSHEAGGTSPFSYQWYSSGTGSGACNSGTSITGATSAAYTTGALSASVYYCYEVTDSSGAGATTAYSGWNLVTVNPTLGAGAVTPSSPGIDTGQAILLTSHETFGTPTFSYQWYSSATGTGACSSGTSLPGATAATYTSGALASSTYYCYEVTDSSLGTTGAESALSTWDLVTVNAALAASPVSPAVPGIDTGQAIALAAHETGGTSTFSYQWYSSATGLGACDAGTSITGATSTSYTTAALTTTTFYCYTVTDSSQATGGPETASSTWDLVTVNPALGANAVTPGAPGIDTGQAIALTSHETGGTASFSYQWYSSATGSGACNTGASISGATAASYTSGALATTTYYCYVVTDSSQGTTGPETASSAWDLVTINPALSAGAVLPGSPSINSGQSITLTSQAAGGTPSDSYQWYSSANGGGSCSSGSAISGATSSTYATGAISSSTFFCYVVTDSSQGTTGPESAGSGWDLVTVNSPLVANAVTPGAPGIDSAQAILLTSHETGGTPAFSYQWYSSTTGTGACNAGSSLTGATSSTYTTAALASSTYFCYTVTDSSSAGPQTASSAWDLVTVNPTLGAGPVTPGSPGLDVGQTITLTSQESGGTTAYAYQWYSSATGTGSCSSGSSIAGATAATYGTGALATDTYYCYTVTDSSQGTTGPESAGSVWDLVTVNAALAAGAVTPGSPGMDSGQAITLTSHASGGTPGLSYQWYLSATGSGSCKTGTTIAGATAATYTTALLGSSTYYCYVVTDSSQATGGPETVGSAWDLLTVNAALTAGAVLPASPGIDTGQAIALTSQESGGTPTFSYQWYSSATGSGACNTGSAIAGAASPTYTSGALASNTYYCYVVTDSSQGLTGPETASSSWDLVSIYPMLTASAVTPGSPSIDDGQTILLTSHAAGGTPALSYQWYVSATGTGSCSGGTVIAGATASTYTTPTIASDTYYCYVVTDSSLGTSGPESASTAWDLVLVNPALVAGAVTPGSPSLDAGQSLTLTSHESGGTAAFSYQWYSSGTGSVGCASGTSITGATAVTYATLALGATTYFCYTVTDSSSAGAETVGSGWDTVTVNPVLVAGAITPVAPAIDDTQSVTLTANPTGGTTPYSLQWYDAAGCPNSGVIAGATSATYDASPASTTTYSYEVTDHAFSPVTLCSGSDTVTVNPLPSASPSASPNPTGVGVNTVFTGSFTGGTGPFSFSWRYGDGSTVPSSFQDPTHVYNATGTFTARFWVNDSVGESSSGTVVVTVTTLAASASASVNPVDVGIAVVFTGGQTGGVAPYHYAWRYDDGSPTSYYISPTHTFNVSGAFLVKLWVNDSTGTTSIADVAMIVNAIPTVAASAAPNPTDVGYATSLIGTGSGGTNALYLWRCPNGFASGLGSPSTSFATVGSITCWVWYNDTWYHAAPSSVTLTVNADPSIGSLSITPNPTDIGASVSLGATGSGGSAPVSYAWRCDDGFIASGASVVHTFLTAGTFTCTVWYNDSLLSASQAASVTIHADPSVTSVSATPATTDAGVAVTLSATYAGGTSPTITWWNCSDGFASSSASPSHAFASAGTYTCRAWYNDTWFSSTRSLSIVIAADPSVSGSGAPNPTDVGVAVSLSSVGVGGTSATYAWRCAGGFASVLQNPTTTFSTAGSPVCNVWFNDTWRSSFFTFTETVNVAPSITASAPRLSMDAGQTLLITGSPAGGTSPYSCKWYVNGSYTGITTCASYSFTPTGPGNAWTAYVTVTDAVGVLATSGTLTIKVAPALAPSATGTHLAGDVGQTFVFGGAVVGGTSPYTCQWYVSGAAVSGATSCASMSYLPTAAGSLPVYLHVLDAAWGQANSSTLTLVISADPTLALSTTATAIDLTESALVSGAVTGGTSPFTCRWYVNGVLQAGSGCASFTFSPLAVGSDTVNATVVDAALWNASSNTVTIVVAPDPTATETPASANVDANEGILLTSTVRGGTAPVVCAWTLNGTVITGATSCTSYWFVPGHGGIFTVGFLVRDSANPSLSAWANSTITGWPPLVGALSPSFAALDVGMSQLFTCSVISGAGAACTTWFVNGTLTGGSGATWTFHPAGAATYAIGVLLTDHNGNAVWVNGTAVVGSELVVALTPGTGSEIGVGKTLDFTATSDGGTSPIRFVWYVNGLAQPPSGADLAFTEATVGSYRVNVSASDVYGETANSVTVTLQVVSVSVTVTGPTAGEVGVSTTYTATPAGGVGPYTYQWSVDGTVVAGATSSTFAWTPGATGAHAVSVEITDSGGIQASGSMSVSVSPAPSVTLEANVSSTVVGSSVLLQASVQGGTGPFVYTWLWNGTAPIAGATGSSYTFTPTAGGSYTFVVEVEDADGLKASSPSVAVTVTGPTTTTKGPSTGTSGSSGLPFSDLLALLVVLAIVVLLVFVVVARRRRVPKADKLFPPAEPETSGGPSVLAASPAVGTTTAPIAVAEPAGRAASPGVVARPGTGAARGPWSSAAAPSSEAAYTVPFVVPLARADAPPPATSPATPDLPEPSFAPVAAPSELPSREAPLAHLAPATPSAPGTEPSAALVPGLIAPEVAPVAPSPPEEPPVLEVAPMPATRSLEASHMPITEPAAAGETEDVSGEMPACPRCGSPLPSARSECLVCRAHDADLEKAPEPAPEGPLEPERVTPPEALGSRTPPASVPPPVPAAAAELTLPTPPAPGALRVAPMTEPHFAPGPSAESTGAVPSVPAPPPATEPRTRTPIPVPGGKPTVCFLCGSQLLDDGSCGICGIQWAGSS